jgi:hypothetical protein
MELVLDPELALALLCLAWKYLTQTCQLFRYRVILKAD